MKLGKAYKQEDFPMILQLVFIVAMSASVAVKASKSDPYKSIVIIATSFNIDGCKAKISDKE